MTTDVIKDNETEQKKPMTIGTVIIGLLVAAVAGALCYYTWMETDLLDSIFELDASGRGARKVKFFLWLIYNRVTGSVAGIISLLMIWGSLASILKLIKGSKKWA